MDEKIIKAMEIAFDKDLSGAKLKDCLPGKIEGWDSISFLNLLVLLEGEFSISIPLEDIEELSLGGLGMKAVIERALE